MIITFKKIIEAVEIKIHSNFDDRDIKTGEVINRAEFSNLLEEMVRVYGRYNRTKISYEYDEVGNRISETYTGPDFDYSITYNYDYYSNSNRLKVRESEKVESIVPSNGSYVDGLFRVGPAEKRAYRYDKAGNLIEKGNKYSISGDSVGFTEKSGNGVLYWKYEYNAKNRLTEVFKDGESEENRIARYGYDFSGKRLKVEEGGKVTYYVYNYFGQLIYEDGEKDISYIYAFRKVVAKVEGSIGSGEEKYYYYHHDNLGSTRLITDEAGKVVFEQEYSPFGRDLYKPGRYEKPDNLEAGFKYTGQIADVNTGLYYYNARYYDGHSSEGGGQVNMKKLIIILVSFIIFCFSFTGFCSEIVPVNLNLESFNRDVEWSPDSQKIALYTNGAVYVISLDGRERKIKEIDDASSMLNLEWLNNEKVIFGDCNIIEIIDINSLETETFFVHNLFFISYNSTRNELAISSNGKIDLLSLESKELKPLIYYSELYEIYYNKNGSKLFFTGYGLYGYSPFLYVFNFEDWTFDRVSKEYLLPMYINKEKDILFCVKGSGMFIDDKNMVAVNMNTLEVSDYEPENDLEIKGVKMDSNFDDFNILEKDIDIFLSHDRQKAFFVKGDKGEFIFLE